jgi:Flp pilus assembly protein TadD
MTLQSILLQALLAAAPPEAGDPRGGLVQATAGAREQLGGGAPSAREVSGPRSEQVAGLPTDYEAARAEAQRLTQSGDLTGALSSLAEAAAAFPEDFGLRLQLAALLLRAGDWVGSATAYRVALALSGEDLEARIGLADALAGAGSWAEARPILAALVEQRPGNAGLHDRYARALFWLEAYSAAEAQYRLALEARPDEPDARLGLAWIAERRGERVSARAGFEEVQRLRPEDTSARAGLAALGTASRVTPFFHTGVMFSDSTVSPTSQYLLVGGLSAQLLDRWLVGGLYRWSGAFLGLAPPGASSLLAQQHEGHLSVAFADQRWGVGLHGGYVGVVATPTTSVAHSGGLAALSGRVTLWGDLTASVSGTFYDDLKVWQADLGYSLPVASHLELFLGGRLIVAGGSPLGAVRGEVRVFGASWLVAAGATYGTQLRPVELDTSSIYNLSDPLLWRAWARARVQLGTHVNVFASYDYERYQHPGTQLTDSGGHRVTLGLGLTF